RSTSLLRTVRSFLLPQTRTTPIGRNPTRRLISSPRPLRNNVQPSPTRVSLILNRENSYLENSQTRSLVPEMDCTRFLTAFPQNHPSHQGVAAVARSRRHRAMSRA